MAAESASVHMQSAGCASLNPSAVDWQNTKYPDAYSSSLRFFGLYPLTRIPFVMGVEKELAKTHAHYDEYAQVTLDPERWQVFGLSESSIALNTSNPLLTETFRQALSGDVLQRHAPQFAVEVGGEPRVNRPGLPVRSTAGAMQWLEQPVMLSYASLGAFAGRQTLQLNYQIWFAARPARGGWDPLAGELDGLHWRVHLDQQLTPLAFDVMHTCGCWYQVFPARGYHLRAKASYWQEPVFVGEAPVVTNPMLLVTADTHSLVGLRAPTPSFESLQPVMLAPAMVGSKQALSEDAKAHRRLFNEDGYVPESSRAERYFFWPMGIPAAGSMRAPGRHAIAFTGRRHFDEPDLLDQLGLAPAR